MNKTESDEKVIRPTKKQLQLLSFIAAFIAEHGYSPSYREIMRGCDYTSVATVALHINSLITRGHLRKRDKSARSLEVVDNPEEMAVQVSNISEAEEKWLVLKVEHFFKLVEEDRNVAPDKIDELYVLVGALKVLGLDGAAYLYIRRLNEIRTKMSGNNYVV